MEQNNSDEEYHGNNKRRIENDICDVSAYWPGSGEWGRGLGAIESLTVVLNEGPQVQERPLSEIHTERTMPGYNLPARIQQQIGYFIVR